MTTDETITIYVDGIQIVLPADSFVYLESFSDPAPVTEADDKARYEAIMAGEAI